MKTKTTLLISASMLALTTLKAQTFPLIENFDTTTDSTLPAGWVGGTAWYSNPQATKSMVAVHSNFGVSNSKALRLRTQSTYAIIDSVYTPVISSLPANTTLDFVFRYEEIGTYNGTNPPVSYTNTAIPFGKTNELGPGPAVSGNFYRNYLNIYVVNPLSLSEILIHQINSNNHIASSTYQPVSINLANFLGQNIRIKVKHVSEIVQANRDIYIDNFSVNALATEIKENSSLNGVKLYPNPTKNNFTLEAKEPVTIKVYNVMGQIVFTSSENKITTNIDIDNQPSGVYVVEAIGQENNSSYRLIKE